jgi:hypothetical protein
LFFGGPAEAKLVTFDALGFALGFRLTNHRISARWNLHVNLKTARLDLTFIEDNFSSRRPALKHNNRVTASLEI